MIRHKAQTVLVCIVKVQSIFINNFPAYISLQHQNGPHAFYRCITSLVFIYLISHFISNTKTLSTFQKNGENVISVFRLASFIFFKDKTFDVVKNCVFLVRISYCEHSPIHMRRVSQNGMVDVDGEYFVRKVKSVK